jgi:hypothetical protein
LPEESDLDLARRFAPYVTLAGDEPYAPMAPDVFIKESRLVWRTSARRAPVTAKEGAIAPARLGALGTRSAAPYTAPDADFSATDFTRPFDTGRDRGGLSPERGFGIVHRDVAPGRVGSTAELRDRVGECPAFFELERLPSGQALLCYWLYFGSSTYPLGFTSWRRWVDWLRRRVDAEDPDGLREILAGQIAGPDPFPLDAADIKRLVREHVVHQGDWEGITVVLGPGGEPSHAIYRAHAEHAVAAWGDVPREDDTRPLVLCAKGSHASYAGEGPLSREYNDVLAKGRRAVRWDPARRSFPSGSRSGTATADRGGTPTSTTRGSGSTCPSPRGSSRGRSARRPSRRWRGTSPADAGLSGLPGPSPA